jgi:hypothetical protein
MNFKKFLAVALMIFVSFSAFALNATGVIAADSEETSGTASEAESPVEEGGYFDVTYDATDAYKGSKYYENLKKVPKTGSQAINVIAVALSQVGYHEGNDESEFHGLNAEGNGDFVEYNMVFGKIDYNVRYGYSWCASFATWCLRQAGVDPYQSAQTAEFNNEFKKTYISTWQWKNAFENAGSFHAEKEYKPLVGDLIFFKDVDDSSLEVATSHVGIVLYADETTVYTVEGNTNSKMGGDHAFDCVAIKSYPLDSKYIVGYGRPTYKTNDESATYVWREESKTDAKPIKDMLEKAMAGEQIVPQKYEAKAEEPAKGLTLRDVAEVTYTAAVLVGIAAAVVFILITILKKRPSGNQKTKSKKKA